MGPFQILLFVVWAVSAVALTILVLMHSGKGTGVSDMIASSLYNSSSATGVMEQNLDRLTVIMAGVFLQSDKTTWNRAWRGERLRCRHVFLPAGHRRLLSIGVYTFVRGPACAGPFLFTDL